MCVPADDFGPHVDGSVRFRRPPIRTATQRREPRDVADKEFAGVIRHRRVSLRSPISRRRLRRARSLHDVSDNSRRTPPTWSPARSWRHCRRRPGVDSPIRRRADRRTRTWRAQFFPRQSERASLAHDNARRARSVKPTDVFHDDQFSATNFQHLAVVGHHTRPARRTATSIVYSNTTIADVPTSLPDHITR